MEKHLKCQAYTSCLQFVLWGEGRGGEGRGKGGCQKPCPNSPFQEVGFLTEKKKENSFMFAEQKLSYIFEYNLKAFFFDKLVKFKTDIVGGWGMGSRPDEFVKLIVLCSFLL